MHRRPLTLLALVLLAGCGSSSSGSAELAQENALVDPNGDLPTVMELAAGPDGLLLSTNKGLFKVAGGKAEPMQASVTAEGTKAAVGKTMAFTQVEGTTLVGSGHPNDEASPLPTELGILRSEDGGATWSSVARLGDADLHMFVVRHDRIYAWDAILGAVLVSKDDGKTYEEGITPPGPVVDLAVDPESPEKLVIAGETALFRSEDGAQTWRPLSSATDARLVWPEGGPLVRADSDGSVHQSPDGGETWEQVGEVDGQPQDFHASDDGTIHLALADGSIVRSSDDGRTWQPELEV
jgi:hypothetical protein